MISSRIENALNRQIDLEGFSSMYYLSMASWCQVQGFNGSHFLTPLPFPPLTRPGRNRLPGMSHFAPFISQMAT